MSVSLGANRAVQAELTPNERWQQKSAPCTRQHRIMQLASAILAAVGAAVSAAATYGIVAMRIHPVAGVLVSTIGLCALVIGAVFFTALCCHGEDYDYHNPETAKMIAKNLSDEGIDMIRWYVPDIDACAKHGIIPEEHAEPIKAFMTRYCEVEDEGRRRIRQFGFIPLEKQAELVQKMVAINTEWKAYRERTKFAAELPTF